jgi:hypothetical protein
LSVQLSVIPVFEMDVKLSDDGVPEGVAGVKVILLFDVGTADKLFETVLLKVEVLAVLWLRSWEAVGVVERVALLIPQVYVHVAVPNVLVP